MVDSKNLAGGDRMGVQSRSFQAGGDEVPTPRVVAEKRGDGPGDILYSFWINKLGGP
jgi:hypothetical protein